MSTSKIITSALLSCLALGCGDSSSSTGDGGNGGTTGSGSNSTSGGGDGGNGASNGGDGATGTTGSGAGCKTTTPSEDCKTYCACHDEWCADTEIPNKQCCFDFCEAFSADKEIRDCRMLMCKLVKDQPNNNHCRHAVGLDQCPP